MPCQSQAICRIYREHSKVGPDQKDRFICRATGVVLPNF